MAKFVWAKIVIFFLPVKTGSYLSKWWIVAEALLNSHIYSKLDIMFVDTWRRPSKSAMMQGYIFLGGKRPHTCM